MIGVITYEVVVLPIFLFQCGRLPGLLDQPSNAMAGSRSKHYTILFKQLRSLARSPTREAALDLVHWIFVTAARSLTTECRL